MRLGRTKLASSDGAADPPSKVERDLRARWQRNAPLAPDLTSSRILANCIPWQGCRAAASAHGHSPGKYIRADSITPLKREGGTRSPSALLEINAPGAHKVSIVRRSGRSTFKGGTRSPLARRSQTKEASALAQK